jgi:hypothetical protein
MHLIELINKYNWSHFITITNTNAIGINSFKKKYKTFFKHLNNKENKYFDKYIWSLVCFERDNNSGSHIHAFASDLDKAKSQEIENKLKTYFGQSKVLIYDSKDNAKYYISNKYNKNKLIDFDLLKINSRIR